MEAIDVMNQYDYVNFMLKENNISYPGKQKYIQSIIENVMDNFVGTKNQCDKKYEEVKIQAQKDYTNYKKYYLEKYNEFEEEWFNYRTKDMTEYQKYLVKSIYNEFCDNDIERAIEFVESNSKYIK